MQTADSYDEASHFAMATVSTAASYHARFLRSLVEHDIFKSRRGERERGDNMPIDPRLQGKTPFAIYLSLVAVTYFRLKWLFSPPPPASLPHCAHEQELQQPPRTLLSSRQPQQQQQCRQPRRQRQRRRPMRIRSTTAECRTNRRCSITSLPRLICPRIPRPSQQHQQRWCRRRRRLRRPTIKARFKLGALVMHLRRLGTHNTQGDTSRPHRRRQNLTSATGRTCSLSSDLARTTAPSLL